MSSVATFWVDWYHESNPWREAFKDGDWTLERRSVLFFAMFLALHHTMLALKERGLLSAPLASRPTLIANHLHCVTVSVLCASVLLRGEQDWAGLARWTELGVPLSLAYFAADTYWYALPKRDGLMLFHHLTMIVCHYPIGSLAGARLCGAGDPYWAVRLSCLGYLCEFSNPLMNWRWWLMQTLKKDRLDFAIVNLLLVASFAARTLLLSWIILGVLLPAAPRFLKAKQLFIFGGCVAGHTVILVLSLYWLRVLCKNGLKGLLTFKPVPKSKNFVFGTDMGRRQNDRKKS